MLKTKKYRLLSLVLLTGMLLSSCSDPEAKEGLLTDTMIRPEAANYETTTVRTGHYQAETSGTASVVYMVEASLSYKNSGAKYKETFVKNGNKVAAGDTLMTFEVQEIKSEKVTLELQLRRKREDYRTGKEARQKAIDAEKARAASLTSYDRQISQLQVEKLQIEYDQFVYKTEREIGKLQQQIEDIDERLNDTSLVAPFDGIVSYVFSGTPGDNVTANKILVKIYSTDTVLFQVKTGASSLRYNMPVTLEYGKGDSMKSYTGHVVAAGNVMPDGLEQNKTLIKLDQEIDMKTASNTLSATAQLKAVTEDVRQILVADKDVLNETNEDAFVYILQDDIVHKRYVTVRENKGDTIWILDGVAAGQDLILG